MYNSFIWNLCKHVFTEKLSHILLQFIGNRFSGLLVHRHFILYPRQGHSKQLSWALKKSI